MSSSSVHAVIPNFNMAPSLETLLPKVLEQEYASVYVLDDASTDNSLEVVRSFGDDVQLIAGHENSGAGGNRNRIAGHLKDTALIHFIDADMELDGERLPEICEDIMPSRTIGFVGGLVRELDGRQMIFNYGPRQSLRNDITVPLHLAVAALGDRNPAHEAVAREKLSGLLDRWPNRQQEPTRRETFWTSEANLVVSAFVFNQIGGYDPQLREHEIQDLAIRMDSAGLKRYFDPALAATHTAAQVRDGNRNTGMANAELYIARKHGLLKWLTAK